MNIQTSIQPWLTVGDPAFAADFYTTAFDAVETYRLEIPGGDRVIKLTIGGAVFWLASGETGKTKAGHEYQNIRFILVVQHPEQMMAKALQAGATEVYPVGEGHGWKLGRVVDPFGIHWEIGYELSQL